MEFELIQALAAIKNSIDAAAQPRFIDWIAIVMSGLSVIVSGIAIWFAVQVPRKIADRQDKIALFEKRYELYSLLNGWRYLSEQIIAFAMTNNDARSFFIVLYDDGCQDHTKPTDSMVAMYRKTIGEITKLTFLFSVGDESCKQLMLLVNAAHEVLIGNELTKHKEKLVSLMESPEIKHIFETMQKELRILE